MKSLYRYITDNGGIRLRIAENKRDVVQFCKNIEKMYMPISEVEELFKIEEDPRKDKKVELHLRWLAEFEDFYSSRPHISPRTAFTYFRDCPNNPLLKKTAK